jgi:cob(I)alamin adenosyltransferase
MALWFKQRVEFDQSDHKEVVAVPLAALYNCLQASLYSCMAQMGLVYTLNNTTRNRNDSAEDLIQTRQQKLQEYTKELESMLKRIDVLNEGTVKQLPNIHDFTVMGGCRLSLAAHDCNDKLRELELMVWTYIKETRLDSSLVREMEQIGAYINRLSAWMYNMSRYYNHVQHVALPPRMKDCVFPSLE